MIRAHFAGLDSSGLRDDIGACEKVRLLGIDRRTCPDGISPFQTDRAQSARVGNIATLCVNDEVGECFRRLPMVSGCT